MQKKGKLGGEEEIGKRVVHRVYTWENWRSSIREWSTESLFAGEGVPLHKSIIYFLSGILFMIFVVIPFHITAKLGRILSVLHSNIIAPVIRVAKTVFKEYQLFRRRLGDDWGRLKEKIFPSVPFIDFTIGILLIGLMSLFTIVILREYYVFQDITGIFTVRVFDVSKGSLKWTAAYLSIAMGITLTYRVMKFANFAHGEYFVIGFYVGASMQSWVVFSEGKYFGTHAGLILFIAAVIGSIVITGSIVVLIDFLVFKPLRKKGASPDILMIASLGVSLILRSLLRLIFGGRHVSNVTFGLDSIFTRYASEGFFTLNERNIPEVVISFDLDKNVPRGADIIFWGRNLLFWQETGSKRFYSFLVGETDFVLRLGEILTYLSIIFIGIALLIFLRWAKIGKAMRAVADNPDLASSSGINVERIYLITWFIVGGTAGIGGMLIGPYIDGGVNAETGLFYLLPSFAVVILGTVGSLGGAVIAALIVGFSRSTSASTLSGFNNLFGGRTLTAYAEIVPYVILILTLLLYPRGIGSEIDRRRIEKLRKRNLKALNRGKKGLVIEE